MAPTRRLPLAYGLGILILVAGLAAGGSLGIPRKAPHIDLSLNGASYFVAMGTAAIGGFIALAAVVTMVFFGFRAALRVPTSGGPKRPDVRLWALGSTVLLVVLGGWLLEWLPSGSTAYNDAGRALATGGSREDIDARFEQGVLMLHARQYEHALTAFNYVTNRSPNMPEAYVNMGYALLGLKRYQEAHNLFEHALQLRNSQLNAYYGLAVALEGLGDLPGALGAMQTYAHLAKPDDPYRTKAEAAVWEWREGIRKKAQ